MRVSATEPQPPQDIVLHLRAIASEGKFELSIDQPVPNAGTPPTEIILPPPELWKATGGYYPADVDVERLAGWLAERLGEPIRQVICARVTDHLGPPTRLVIAADAGARAALLGLPWEALEWQQTPLGAPLIDRLEVVRVLKHWEPTKDPLPAGDKLKVAVTWANPRDNVPDLKEHLRGIEDFDRTDADRIELIGPVEFSSVDEVRAALAPARPHVVYHIGHAVHRGQEGRTTRRLRRTGVAVRRRAVPHPIERGRPAPSPGPRLVCDPARPGR